ncbi:MAG: hypothetical protein JXA58_04925 [Dehalococcoidia bacterium]|nr:hypothetical protein [Dehalococcoidia bacterium]
MRRRLVDFLFGPTEPAYAGTHLQGGTEEMHGPTILHMAASSGRPRRIVNAGRRRRPSVAPSGGRPRASTPRRETASSGGGTTIPPLGGSGGTTSGSPLGGGGLPFNLGRGRSGCGCLTVIVIVVIIGIVAVFLLGGLQCPALDLTGLDTGDGSVTPTSGSPTGSVSGGQLSGVTPASDFTTHYPATATEGTAGQTWLVMLYQDADDNVLEKDIYLDLNEAEKAGSSDRVTVVAQIDRYQGGFSGDGNWTGAKRFVVVADDDLTRVSSHEAADLGEINMASAQTLYDYIIWAMENFPADNYVLILSDHGLGWPGGWTDPTPKAAVDSSSPLSARLGNMLFLNRIDEALEAVRTTTGLDKFELIGLDACLMGQLEVFTALEPHARYAVASEEVEPALGWAYTGFMQELIQNPDMSGAELSRLIVETYIQEDQTIVDRTARADYLSQNSPLAGLFGSSTNVSSEQMAREIGQKSTLSALDLSQVGNLNASLNQLAYALQGVDQKALASSRNYAQSFTNIFGSGVPASYIDLGHFLQLLQQNSSDGTVRSAADNVLAAIDQTIVAEKHGAKMPGATGIAVYYPNSQLYQNSLTGAQSYTALADRFAATSLWDDFLAYHYTGQEFALGGTNAVVPSSSLIRAPAAGAFTVSALQASRGEVAPGEVVTLSADISGENIGHIYLFAGYFDRTTNSVYLADQDYLEAGETRQVNGVYYPYWGEGDFTLTFDWEPVIFAMSDGGTNVPALFHPVDYGQTWEEAIYAVDGTYTFAASGEQLDAQAYFVNGVMRQVFGFTGASEAAAPREITPSPGDSFNVWEEWLDLNTSGEVVSRALQPGSTLTFGNQMFTWETLDAAVGEYVVGFIVEDLDGNRQEAFTLIDVI